MKAKRVLFIILSGFCGLMAMAGPALAQGALGGFQQDTRAPIEITADSLEVAQEQGLATFTGNVEALQGGLTLKAQVLKVNYRDQGQNAAADAAGTISRLRADGDVSIASPGENARGDWADYNVDQGRIQMGDAVVLTRGENVLRGTRLDIDLNSGLSRIDGSADGGRVRGIFTPGSN